LWTNRRVTLDDPTPPLPPAGKVDETKPGSATGLGLATTTVPDSGIAEGSTPVVKVPPSAPGSLLSLLAAGSSAPIVPLRIVADGAAMTDASWVQMKPKLDALPPRASEDARAVLAAFADPKIRGSDG